MNLTLLSNTLVVIVTVLYGAAAVTYWFAGRPSTSLIFIGYVIANIALIWQGMNGSH